MTESNGMGAGTDSAEWAEGTDTGHGRHRGTVTASSAQGGQGDQPEPHGRHRGPRAQEA
ncbi:hypothetical protein OKJ48_05470 [Streptomyces kunmingensis]|uniref:Uncharacterized protein n=1 Tax=Streptomyces kunmingensis TaxID=68225 RepID=A0ABU6C4P7_9ACTN|nr:hypothetical protein [Streptomyces kunmingensis]MEB3959699.1 hypothetical protein [Streptomyces kunmingensis]